MSAFEQREFNEKYNFGHLASALSAAPIVEWMYSVRIPILETNSTGTGTDYEIILGKPFGMSPFYKKWLELGYLKDDDLKMSGDLNLLGVYRQSNQNNLNIPNISYVAGSLGNALGVCVGKAICNKDKRFICYLSDGALLMGPTLEAIILIKRFELNNIEVVVDWNGYTAANKTPIDSTAMKMFIEGLGLSDQFIFFENTKGFGIKEIEEDPIKWHY